MGSSRRSVGGCTGPAPGDQLHPRRGARRWQRHNGPVPTPPEMLEDLRAAGWDVSSIWDLVNTDRRYPEAIPILINWLDRLEDADVDGRMKVREGVVRALSSREARPAAVPALIRAMKSTDAHDNQMFGWAVGNALSVTADESFYDDIVDLLHDTALGIGRQMLVYPVGRSSREDATHVLIGLLDDHEISGHAIDALARRRDPASKSSLERFTTDSRPWVRRSAARGLTKMEGQM